jgi:hypothetical protein
MLVTRDVSWPLVAEQCHIHPYTWKKSQDFLQNAETFQLVIEIKTK